MIDGCSIDVMVQVAYIIVGMASMLLIELGMFRDDIISYRPNYKKPFIGRTWKRSEGSYFNFDGIKKPVRQRISGLCL